jgi:cation diffusion facilitator CzcD-associated flavoprotein CzcO
MQANSGRDFDVLILGAGLSGIGAGYHLQKHCPTKSYAILEARESLGGTWDLFRYPGIRSDSDMYTLGYSFKPWTNTKSIADGPAILDYIGTTARENGIDRKIRYGHRATHASWSSERARWTVEVRLSSGATELFTCAFLFACAGYYDYDAGYTPTFEGVGEFKGTLVHPQHWPQELDYTGKRIVVIGSGATAVTLVPELAKRAAHVTMLQRSPTYVLSLPGQDTTAQALQRRLPAKAAYSITRAKNVLRAMAFFSASRRYPAQIKEFLVGEVKKELGDSLTAQHFTPTYKPWDQRVCVVPDGDLFRAVEHGRASVVTDHIERFTETGLRLRSGEHLDADIIVTATGLQLKFLGGVTLEVDGKRVELPQTMTYKAMMLSDVPNLAYAIGYTNASWTLKADLTSEYVCRLLQHMDAHGFTACFPKRDMANVKEEPLMDFSSGYVQRAMDSFPKQGSVAPWRVFQNYILDRMALRHAKVEDGVMQFTRKSPR